MFLNSSFGKKLDILKREMDVTVLRRNVISNNISNADTPNFKRTDVTFEAQLKRALDSEKTKKVPTLMTDEKHISFNKSMDYRDVKPKRVLDYLTTSKNNGNNVDIEVEMMNSMENQLMYETLTRVVSARFNNISVVLK